MKARLMFASLFTVGVLFSFVAAVVLIAMYYGGMISAPLLIGGTIVFSIISWLVSPFIQDLVLRWFYSCEKVAWTDFQTRWPGLAQSLEMSCNKHKVPLPAIRIIDDGNPTAYTFGSGPWNSRLVVTRGLFEYLDENEVTAVFMHELGHIVHRDFIVMTVAATLLTVLYEIYAIAARGKGRGEAREKLAYLGYISYIFYIIGTYMVLYLSRTREYLADRFAAEETGNPNWLATGLVKVAYGIASASDSAKSKRLLASTRALGLYDYRVADATGSAYGRIATAAGAPGAATAVASAMTGTAAAASMAPERVERVFLWDLFNPWAKVGEFNSTHPLTGKRIEKLMEYCREFNQAPVFDLVLAAYEGQLLDRKRMRNSFLQEVGIYYAPALGFLAGLVSLALAASAPSLFAPILGLGIGYCVRGLYSFPGGTAERTTVFELMCDPYASPVRGRLVVLDGKLIGKADAGNPVGEDLVMRDNGGSLMTLNFESWLPIIGNLFFGWRRVKNLIDQPVSALGWFRRYTTAIVDLNQIKSSGQTFESYTRFWSIYRGPVFIALALLLMFGARSI